MDIEVAVEHVMVHVVQIVPIVMVIVGIVAQAHAVKPVKTNAIKPVLNHVVKIVGKSV